MNLVGSYGSSDEGSDEDRVPTQASTASISVQETKFSTGTTKTTSTSDAAAATVAPDGSKGKGKGKATARDAPTNTKTKGKRQSESKRHGDSSKRQKKHKHSSSKKKAARKVTLVLSPEIQAALARGDTLGDSDSDDTSGENKPSKPSIKRSAGDPNDLLSLLPQPATAASADGILLKSQQRRREAAAKKSAASTRGKTTSGGTSTTDDSASSKAKPTPTPTLTPTAAEPSGSVEQNREGAEESDDGEDEDSGEDDLLSSIRAKSSLFTLPSRSKPKPAVTIPDVVLQVHSTSGSGPQEANSLSAETPAQIKGGLLSGLVAANAAGAVRLAHQERWNGQAGDWGGGVAGSYGEVSTGASGGLAQQQEQGQYQASEGYRPPGYATHQQQSKPPLHYSGAQHAGVQAQQQAARSSGVADYGVAGGGAKTSRRRGRDMERALAGGDLGAIGNETAMDLHQGTNDYNPLRKKPITAAMKQEQKHIEGSVYDPRTGQTVKTMEPTTMQKRKHQINQLAVQAAGMERDLMERSGASRLTKAQTHAKYGW